MDDLRYHAAADATLMHCFDQLEDAYEQGAMEELELQSGILTITSASGKTFLLSKHGPSQQLWYASPVSGGLHFRYDEMSARWLLPDGRTLYETLRSELVHEGIAVVL